MCGSPVQAGNKLALTNLSLVGNRVGVVAGNSFIDWNSIVKCKWDGEHFYNNEQHLRDMMV